MRLNTTLIVLIVLVTSLSLAAQKNTRKYNRLVENAKAAELKEDYETSILNYSNARRFKPQQNNFLDERIKVNVSTLKYKISTAEKKTVQIQNTLDETLLELKKVQQLKNINHQLAKTNANTSQALYLAEEDLALALNMGFENYQMFPTAPQSTQTLHQLTSQKNHCRQAFGTTNTITHFVLSADNDLIAVASKFGRLELRQINGALYQTLRSSGAMIKTLAFSPDGSLIAASDAEGVVSIWSQEGTLLATQRETHTLQSIAFLPHQKSILLVNRFGKAYLRDTTGVFQRSLGNEVTASTIATAEEAIFLARPKGKIDVYNGQGIFQKRLFVNHPITQLKVKDELLFLSTPTGSTMLYNQQGNLLLKIPMEEVKQIAFAQDYLVTTNNVGLTQIWDQQGQLLQTLKPQRESNINLVSTTNGHSIWLGGNFQPLEQCTTLNGLLEESKYSTQQLLNAGFRPSWEMIKDLGNTEEAATILQNLYQQQDWELMTRFYETMPATQQQEPAHLLQYYIANDFLGLEQSKFLANIKNPDANLLLAKYFYQKEDWENAEAAYAKVIMDKTNRTPTTVLHWYESSQHLDKKVNLEILQEYGGTNYWKAYGRYFAQQQDWKSAQIFYDTLINSQVVLAPATIIEWYQVHEALGTSNFDYLLQYPNPTHQNYFANYFLQKQDWKKAQQLFEQQLKTHATAQNYLGIYASKKGMGEDDMEHLLHTDSMSHWQVFGDYLVNHNEPERAKIFYEKLLKTEDTPFYRDQIVELDKDLKLYTFSQYFLSHEPQKLRDYISYFYQRGKTKPDGQRVKDYQKAAIISEKLVELDKSNNNKQRLAYFYNLLAWEKMFVGDFEASASYSSQEKEIKAQQKYYRRILPASTLLQGNYKKARKMYRKFHKKRPVATISKNKLKTIYLEDLESFRTSGLVKNKVVEEVKMVEDYLQK